MPVVLIALLLIVQVGVVVRDALALTQAAREGARTAAITAGDDATIESVRRAAGPLDADRIRISIEPPSSERTRGRPARVDLRYEERLAIPVVNRLVSLELPLAASATMRLERSTATPTPQTTATPEPAPSPTATPVASATPSASPTPGQTPSPPAPPTPTPSTTDVPPSGAPP